MGANEGEIRRMRRSATVALVLAAVVISGTTGCAAGGAGDAAGSPATEGAPMLGSSVTTVDPRAARRGDVPSLPPVWNRDLANTPTQVQPIPESNRLPSAAESLLGH